MSDWHTEIVEDCLVRLSLNTAAKLQTQAYRTSGRFPVVDQGQALIAGWTDEEDGLVAADLPVIVFGDHTRAFKYIDFPFVRGADGTQILKPKTEINALFFYYYLKNLELPSRGYNRHFRELKQKVISYPSYGEQKDIACTLRLVEDMLSLQAAQLLTLHDCKLTAMQALFTRGVRGEAPKETAIGSIPEYWEIMPISALGKIVTGTTPPTNNEANYLDGNIPFIAPGDIQHGNHITRTEKSITAQGLAHSRKIEIGATCFVCIGSTIGKVGYVTFPICASNQQINSILPRADFDAQFVFYLMTFWSNHVRTQASPSPVPILSKGAFEQIQIATTLDVNEQREIVAILSVIDRKIDLHLAKRSLLEELFKVLLQKLMTGELRADQLDLAALSSAKPQEAAA
jgi:type I restriction enzyme S subunit